MEGNHIERHWEAQGATFGKSHWASWGDNWAIELEIETIASHIRDDFHVLDVGCANGYSTFRQVEAHRLASITGVDFAESMISEARKSREDHDQKSKITFERGDIRHLRFDDNVFDFTYTTRTLINLSTWEEQKQGIAECLRVTKPGGKVVLSEGFWEPLMLLNALRALKQLSPLVEHDFNRYLKLQRVHEYLDCLGLRHHVDDFSSIYYLGSRFLRELVTDTSAYPGFSNPLNRIFFDIERNYSGGGFGIQQAIVIRK